MEALRPTCGGGTSACNTSVGVRTWASAGHSPCGTDEKAQWPDRGKVDSDW